MQFLVIAAVYQSQLESTHVHLCVFACVSVCECVSVYMITENIMDQST